MSKSYRRCTLQSSAIVLALAAFAAPVGAYAQTATYSFNIPAENLGAALRAFAKTSGQQLVYDNAIAKTKTSGPLVGTFTADDGLRTLLAGSGMSFRRGAQGVFMISEGTTSPQSEGAQSGPAEASEVQEVVVTGTNIRGAAPVGTRLQTFTATQIARTGAFSIQQFLQTLPDNFGGGANEALPIGTPNNTSSQANVGAGAGINLRGLGSGATLVLLNGNRVAPASGIGDFVDISMIPLSAVERVEVLTDGASAIYGGDAVAGVTNIILRKNFDGADTSVRYGGATEGGAGEVQFDQVFGTHWSSGNALITYDYDNRDRLRSVDRSFSADAVQPNDIVPASTRNSVVASISQDILPGTTLAVDGVLSERTSSADNAGFGTQDDSVYFNRLIDINSALHTDLGHSWSLDNSLGYSAVHIKQDDLNFSGGVETEYVSRVNSQQYTADSTISGPLLTLPGGPLKVAVGFHFQRELFTTSLNGSTTKNANRDVYAGYGELLFPLIGHDNNVPLVDRLQFDVSGRVDHYSDFGYTENPKIGVLWGPTKTIDFRASYSTSFKPPVLGYVGANDQSAGVFTNDLINSVFGFSDAVPNSSPFILNGGTAKNLKPETASSFTVGSDYDDELPIGHAHLSVTYYHIDFRNQIGAPQYPNGEFNILNLYLNNPNSVPPGVVVPNPTAAQVNALIASANAANGFHDSFGLYQGPNNVGYIVNFLTGNLARTLTDGLSFDGALTREQFGGNLSFTVNATYVLHYDQQNSPVSPLVNLVNTVYNPIGFKARLGADWQDSNWSVASFVNYTDSYKDTNVTPTVPVGSWTTVDLQVGYHPNVKSGLLSGTRLVLSVSNLFDAKPPFVASNAEFYILGYDPTNASAIGRLVSIQLAKKW